MLRRVSGTAISLLIVAIAYTGYALLVVPWIEPAATASNDIGTKDNWLPMTPRRREELAKLFPPGSWQLDSPTIIESSYGTLLFQENIRTSQTLEIKPCTLLVYAQQSTGHQDDRQAKAGRRIYVLDAPDGALLEHEGNFDLNQTQGGRIVGGRLLGQVSIQSAATSAESNDSVRISTRNIQIDRQRIWTPHEVDFQIGPHHGSGRDLVITLARVNNPERIGQRPDLFNTIDSMELIQVDGIHLKLSRHLLDRDTQTVPGKPSATSSTIPVEIRCQGPLRIDLRKQVVSLEKHVDVLVYNSPGSVDQLTCQQLDLHFKPRRSSRLLSKNSVNQETARTKTTLAAGVEPVELAAIGNPVILRAPSIGTLARAQRMLLNLPRRRILLEDTNQARIVQDNHELLAPYIEYEFAAEPGRLGQFIATGPGRYEGQSGTATRPEFMASWQQECRLVKQQQEHVFSLIGKAQMSQLQHGTVQADDLHVWFREIATTHPVAFEPATKPRTTLANQAPDRPVAANSSSRAIQSRIIPQKMAFRGNVQVDTHQLSARTNLIEVWFREPGITAATSNTDPPVAPPAKPSTTLSLPVTTKRSKLDVSGDQIRLQVALPNPQPAITNLAVDGNVSLRQIDASPNSSNGLQLKAHSLQLARNVKGLAKIGIRGNEQIAQPAEIQAGPLKLIGMDIHLDQQINRMWVAGPGEMHLQQAQASRPPNSTQITWGKRLDFDGQTVTIEKDVKTLVQSHAANGQSTQTRITGALLQATLNRHLNLQQPDSTTPLQLRRLTYGGGINIISQTRSATSQPLSIDQLQVRSMFLDQQTGELQATGPGWGSSVRVDQRKKVDANPMAPPELIYVRVQFENGIVGNILNRHIRFYRRVQTLYGPVPDWNHVLDANIPNGLGEQGIELVSEKLELADLQQQGQSVVLTATGNTHLESQKYSALAHQLKFAQLNSLLVLEGDRLPAQLFLKPSKAGAPDAAAKKIMYWFDTNRLQVEGANFINFRRFPSIQPAAGR
ncbi:MAG TPA: hypothetical protein EYN70_00820 [Planctomycetaceae bacterium]|nr:hypothetical protein [Planctomycetaceae bacterium]